MSSTRGITVTGNAYPTTVPNLPRPAPRRPHRPWCADCKTTVDPDQLDTAGLCARCVRAATSRAAAAARRGDTPASTPARTLPPASTPDRPRRVLLAPHTNTITTRYQNGASLTTIANDYGASPTGVRALLLREGITLRPPRRPRRQDPT